MPAIQYVTAHLRTAHQPAGAILQERRVSGGHGARALGTQARAVGLTADGLCQGSALLQQVPRTGRGRAKVVVAAALEKGAVVLVLVVAEVWVKVEVAQGGVG